MTSSKGWLTVCLIVSLVPAVTADAYNLGGLVAAAVVAFVLLVVVVAMLILGAVWNDWYPAVQRARGRVKVPRDFGKKKEEVQLRLLTGSRAGSLRAPSEAGAPSGGVNRARDTDAPKASWVNGWSSRSSTYARPYEEKDVTLELGEEREEEFQIEAAVVDNETLDLGPFRDIDPLRHVVPATSETTVTPADDGDVYSVVSKSRGPSLRTMDRADEEAGNEPADDQRTRPPSGVSAQSEGVTAFRSSGQTLVAL